VPEDDLAPIKHALEPITKRLGLATATHTATIWRRWHSIVGEQVAEHAEPSSVRDGTLRIRTDSPVWATEIGYLADEIRRRVNAEVGSETVRRVVVWTGPRPPGARRAVSARNDAPTAPSSESPPDPATALRRARAAWERRHRSL